MKIVKISKNPKKGAKILRNLRKTANIPINPKKKSQNS